MRRPTTMPNANPVTVTSPGDKTRSLSAYSVDDGYKPWILWIIAALAVGAATLVLAAEPAQPYQVSDLESLGGTNSRGNTVNNSGWVAGHSNLPDDQSRHATVWRRNHIFDLGTLGGPNSAVPFNVQNTRGIISGISQTATPDPLGETWSSAAFYGGPNNVGFINLGFVWERGEMRALPTLGGNNGFATSTNNRGVVVGWAENNCVDNTCVPPQVLQFRPVSWDTDRHDRIREFPLVAGDNSGAATAINDAGQAVGISGICDQAIGRHTARHAVLWENGGVTDLGNLGAEFWNTPTAINQRGDIVGFAGTAGDPDGNILHSFIWTKEAGIQALGELPGDVHSEAYGINEKRQVVGISCDAEGVCRAFLWENGVMTDLNDLKQPSYTPQLEQAKDINDAGEITGRAVDLTTGVRTAFLARPR